MALLERIVEMQGQGLSDSQINMQLQNEGLPPKDINDALNQAKVKAAVSLQDPSAQPVQPISTNREAHNFLQKNLRRIILQCNPRHRDSPNQPTLQKIKNSIHFKNRPNSNILKKVKDSHKITIVIYALLIKTKVLGDNYIVAIFISLILAGFFIVEASLVEFIKFSSAWFSTGVVLVFFILLLLAFLPGKEPLEFLTKGNWFAWVILGAIVALFIVSSAYVFNWALNWGMIQDWFHTEWFGMILLIIIAIIVSVVLAKSK